MTRLRVLLFGLLVSAAAFPVLTAGAATAHFGCKATAVRAQQAPPFEQNVVGKTSCSDGTSTSQASKTSGSIKIGAAGAFTHGNRRGEAPGAGSLASVTTVT